MKLIFRLIVNENMKLYKRKMLWIMMSILLAIISLTLVITLKSEEKHPKDWKENTSKEVKVLEEQVLDKKIPSDYKEQLKKKIKINKYRINNDIPPLYKDTALGFVKSTAGYTGIITLFIIILSSSSVSQEYSWGTIKLLLIRPVSRWKFILAKFLSIIMNAFILYIMLFFTSLIIGLIVFGFDNTSLRYVYYFKGDIYDVSIFKHFIQYFGSKFIGVIMIASFAFMLSTLFRSNTLAITLSIIIQFTGTLSSSVLSFLGKEFTKYIFFTNTNIYQYVEGTPSLGMSLSFSIGILFIYFVLFMTISIVVFQKRDIIT